MRLGWVILAVGLMAHAVGAQTAFDADWDGSGRVYFGDFLIFAGAFGSDDARCDLNGDGRVGFEDFLIFVQSCGKIGRLKFFLLTLKC